MAQPPSSPILKELEKVVACGYGAHTVFDDWIELMFWALQRNDEEYLKVVKRYRNEREQGKREIDYLCNAFGLLMQEMKKTNEETLGRLYMDWEVMNRYAGQYFTPWHVAVMMAKMLGPREGEAISDIACGSGVMLIAACKEMTNEQLDKTTFMAQDMDWTCVMMCALNFTFFNLNGYIIWGDTLANERRRVFGTVRSYFGGSLVEVKEQKEVVEVANVLSVDKQAGQGHLF